MLFLAQIAIPNFPQSAPPLVDNANGQFSGFFNGLGSQLLTLVSDNQTLILLGVGIWLTLSVVGWFAANLFSDKINGLVAARMQDD